MMHGIDGVDDVDGGDICGRSCGFVLVLLIVMSAHERAISSTHRSLLELGM